MHGFHHSTTYHLLLTTYYYLLPALIQDISHDQITESRSCGPDDATAAAAAAAAAAATAAADAADAAAANANAGLSWGGFNTCSSIDHEPYEKEPNEP